MKIKITSMTIILFIILQILLGANVLSYETEVFGTSSQRNVLLDDIRGHWARDEIVDLIYNNYLFGYPTDDGFEIKLDRKITRAEFVDVLMRVTNFSLISENKVSFEDVEQGVWYQKNVDIAVSNDFISGDEDGLFNPDGLISKAEIVSMVNKLDAWNQEDVEDFEGLFTGNLEEDATRAEAFIMVAFLTEKLVTYVEEGAQSSIINPIYIPESISTPITEENTKTQLTPALIMILIILFICVFISANMILRMLLKDSEEVSLRLSFIKNDMVEFKEEVKHKNVGVKNVFQSLIKGMSKLFGRFTPDGIIKEYQNKVKIAGRPFGFSAQDWIALHIFLVVLLPFATVFFFWGSDNMTLVILFCMLQIFLGLGIPRFILGRKQKLRFERIQEDLPSTLDLLTICVEAGSSLDGAMHKVVEKMDGPISEEFDTILKEMKLGSSKIEAFRDFGERVPLDDVKTFVRAMIQAERTGSRIGNILKLISADIRENKKMRMKAKIGKAVVKILIPMVVFIMPTIVIVVMGPVILRLVRLIIGADILGGL